MKKYSTVSRGREEGGGVKLTMSLSHTVLLPSHLIPLGRVGHTHNYCTVVCFVRARSMQASSLLKKQDSDFTHKTQKGIIVTMMLPI